jgi:hypothetical protein
MADQTNRTSTAGEDPAGKWEELIDEWVDCTKATLDRAAVRARESVQRARAGRYGLGEWLDDVRWFWSSAAEDASHAMGTAQDTTAGRARTDPGGRR